MQICRYPEVWCNCHVASFFEASVLNEVRSLYSLSPQELYNADDIKIKLLLLIGAKKCYFTHYLCVVIISFNAGSYKSAFITCSFGKLAFWISALFVLFALLILSWIRCNVHKLSKFCMIIVCTVDVRFFVFLFSLIWNNL